MSKIIFISYSSTLDGQDDDGLQARQTLLNKSAVTVSNADKQIAWTREHLLDTDFFKQNKKILNQQRGAGYWAWKPYIILQTLNQSSPNDWVIYSDVGKSYRRNDSSRCGNSQIGNVMNVSFDAIINYARQNNGFTPGTWVPHYGNAKQWTKRDCFVGMGCDYPQYHNSGHVMAGYSCWSNSKASRDYLTQWLGWCQIEAIISDKPNIYGKPNFSEFIDHRHDQSINTNLVLKNKIKLFNSPTKSLSGFRDFNLIIRHIGLSDHLTDEVKSLEILFGTSPIFPHNLKAIIQLCLLPDLKPNCKINVNSTAPIDIWQKAFPNSIVSSNQFKLDNSKTKEEYTSVFITNLNEQQNLPLLLIKSYESLLPGGVLFFGPYKGAKSTQAKLNSSFNDFIQWIFINQCFPPNLSTKQNQLPNAFTLGNANNPLTVNSIKDESYTIFRKPHINLSLL